MNEAAFEADARLDVDIVASPNCGPRRGVDAPDMLILHYTGMRDANEALERLCSPQAEVSAHYLVFEDGRIVQSVPEDLRAWHAGVSSWAGIEDVNSHSIGIEIANPGHDFGYPDFPAAQVAAVIALCRDIVVRRNIAPRRILAHSDIAPMRKQDPGEKFPWRLLHEAGVGLWIEPSPIGPEPGPRSQALLPVQAGLRDFGYAVPVRGNLDDETRAVVRAFQRHFRPALVDGIVDSSTRQTLAALLEQIRRN